MSDKDATPNKIETKDYSGSLELDDLMLKSTMTCDGGTQTEFHSVKKRRIKKFKLKLVGHLIHII